MPPPGGSRLGLARPSFSRAARRRCGRSRRRPSLSRGRHTHDTTDEVKPGACRLAAMPEASTDAERRHPTRRVIMHDDSKHWTTGKHSWTGRGYRCCDDLSALNAIDVRRLYELAAGGSGHPQDCTAPDRRRRRPASGAVVATARPLPGACAMPRCGERLPGAITRTRECRTFAYMPASACSLEASPGRCQ